MSSAQNQRVEVLAEAIEELVLNCIISVQRTNRATPGAERVKEINRNMQDARGSLRVALRDLIAPVFRLVDGGARQVDATLPDSNQITCGKCGRHFICQNSNCPDWHRAVRIKLAHIQDGEPDDGPEAA